MPEDEAELLSDIRYIDERGNKSPLSTAEGRRTRGLKFARVKNNFSGAGINATWRRSYR